MASPKTVDEFRQDFVEFASDTAYPDDAVRFWLTVAYEDLNAERIGNKLDLAAELFTAHMLVLGRRNALQADFGKVPGAAVGVVTSRSVDKASVSYDSSMVSEKGAGFWNTTDYGLRLWWIFRTRCLGPVYRAPVERFRLW